VDLGAEKMFAAEKAGRKIAIELKEFTSSSKVSEPLFRFVVQRNKINLLIYQSSLEMIVEWRTHNDTLKF
jgi:XisH protein